MTKQLRVDLLAILLEECYGMRENYAREIASDPTLAGRNRDVLDSANRAIDRIEARCSKILG